MLTKKEFFKFPINYFAVPMGLLGLSSEMAHFVEISTFELAKFSFIVNSVAWLVFTVAIGFFVKNLVTSQGRMFVLEQWRCPHSLIEFSIFSLTLILFLYSIHSYLPIKVAEFSFYILLIFHAFLNIEVFKRWQDEHYFVIENIKPILFVLLSGNFMVVIAGHRFLSSSTTELLWFYFSASLLFWLVFLVFVIYRLMFSTSFPKNLRPSLFIILSPPSLAIVAYQLLTEQNILNTFTLVIFNFTLFIFIFLVIQYTYFKRAKLTMLGWAYIFPVASFGLAVQSMY